MENKQSHRKDEHVSLAKKFHQKKSNAGFSDLHFLPNSLPQIGIDEVDLSTTFLGKNLPLPFYIEAMTGGSQFTKQLNAKLGRIAAEIGLPIASGSESVALNDPEQASSFSILRQNNPDGFILANLSPSSTPEQALKAIKLLNADALEIHLNPLQELIMPEGERSFAGWADNLTRIREKINLPIMIKEVGFGMTKETILKLKNLGFSNINVSGRGGTNFAQIENFRRKNKDLTFFSSWGLNTVQSLYQAQLVPGINVIASGGITSPLDIAKSLYLGADSVGVASTILVSLIDDGETATIEMIKEWIYGLKAIFVSLGVKNITELRKQKAIKSTDLNNYLNQIKK